LSAGSGGGAGGAGGGAGGAGGSGISVPGSMRSTTAADRPSMPHTSGM
jgi:hypothetical protein